MNLPKFIKKYIPVIIKQDELAKLVGDSAAAAVFEERKWGRAGRSRNPYDSYVPDEWELTGVTEHETLRKFGIIKESKEKVKEALRIFKEFTMGGFFTNRSIGDRNLDGYKAPSIDQTLIIQDAAHIRAHTDPHGKSIVANVVNFTIGKGVKVDCIEPKVNEVIKQFRYQNNMARRERSMVKFGYISGEYFGRIFCNPESHYIRVSQGRPDFVTDIEFLEGDASSQTGFKYEYDSSTGRKKIWIPSIKLDLYKKWNPQLKPRFNPVANQYMQFVKYGENDGESRGRVPMHCILRYLKYFENWLIDRIRLNHERSKVVWIRENTGTGAATPSNPMSAPKGGIMLEESHDIRYRIENPKLEAGDAKEDGMAILYTIGSGVVMPIHILDQRASEEVYASIRKADTPFSQMIEAHQELWKDHWDELYKFVIRKNIEWGTLKSVSTVPTYFVDPQKAVKLYAKVNEMYAENASKETILKELEKMKEGGKRTEVNTETISINQVFPDVVKEDPLDTAKVLQIHRSVGIASLETLASRAGYNWRQELAKIQGEKEAGIGVEEPDDKEKPKGKPDDTKTKKE